MNEIPEYYTILFQAAEQAIQRWNSKITGLRNKF